MKDIGATDEVLKLLDKRSATHVQIGFTDHTGQIRGKYISKSKFIEALETGIAMTRNFAAVDFNDVIYPVEGLIVNGGGFGDSIARIVPESCREVPWEAPQRNLFFLIEHTGEGVDYDPRVLCRRILEKAHKMGFKPYLSCELEFRLFNETARTLYEKDFRGLELATPSSNYLSVMRQTAWSEFFGELVDNMEHMGIPIECVHWELAPGFAELVMGYAEGMRAADNAVIYKTFAKAAALKRDFVMSFMARLNDSSDGSSCHVHTSLRGIDDSYVFFDDSKPNKVSDLMLHFIGGMQQKLPEVTLMLAPNVNSYKRFVPGIFAPVASSWGIDNRTTSMRAITGTAKSQRVENRVPGADVNPYLAIAALFAAGLWGIENEVEPTDEVTCNINDVIDTIPEKLLLPTHLGQAIDKFRSSEFAKEQFGTEFVRIFADNKAAHLSEFQHAITDWEIRRFLEMA